MTVKQKNLSAMKDDLHIHSPFHLPVLCTSGKGVLSINN